MPAKVPPRIIRFKVPRIMCGGCAQTIKSTLMKSKTVAPKRVYVNWPKKEVCVTIEGDREESDERILELIKKDLNAVGFSLKPAKPIWTYVVKGAVGLLAGLALLIVAATGMAMPMLAMGIVTGLGSLLTLYLGYDTYRSAAVKLFKARTLTMDALFAVSTITAVVVSIAAIFVPWLPMLLDAALMIFGFRHIGTAIEETARRKVMQGVTFRDRVPRTIELEELDAQGVVVRKIVDVDTLKPGDKIIVRRGEVIPVDGHSDDAESYVYETIYNGNTQAVKIAKHHTLMAGMKVGDQVEKLTMTVSAYESDSYLARADKIMDDAQSNSAPMEDTASKVLRYFVPAVFAIALVSGIIIGCLFAPALAIQCVIATLVSACPCTLGFIIPLAVNVGINKGRKHGVEFKGGKPLQEAARVNTVVFDLNGTLTTGNKVVEKVHVMQDTASLDDVLDKLYRLEKRANSKHAIGKAIRQYAKTSRATKTNRALDFDVTEMHGGIRACIEGEWYTLGNRTLLAMQGITVPSPDARDEKYDHQVYLARGNEVIAVIHLSDPLRDDAKAVVKSLRDQGKQVYICTGSDEQTANRYADKLGLPRSFVQADCVPVDDSSKKMTKSAFIQSLKAKGRRPAIIGDGGNDALAMKHCLGVAIRSHVSDEVTEDNAGAVITGRSLSPVLATFSVAKQTLTNIKISLGISLAYNMGILLVASGLLVAVGFVLNPAVGVALMVTQACLVLGLAYYFKKKQLPSLKETISGKTPQAQARSTHSTLKHTLKHCFKPTLRTASTPPPPVHAAAVKRRSRQSVNYARYFRRASLPIAHKKSSVWQKATLAH